jgi:hypothetical protein
MVIFDVAGELILKQAVPGASGFNQVVWGGVNSAGGRLASGTYLVRFRAVTDYGAEDDFWVMPVIRR